jgi:hypothetical protein
MKENRLKAVLTMQKVTSDILVTRYTKTDSKMILRVRS